MSLISWWQNRKRFEYEKRRVQGYNWAAGALLRGQTVDDILMQIDCPFDESDPFDRGARKAIIDWTRLSDLHKSSSMYVTQEMINNFLRREQLTGANL